MTRQKQTSPIRPTFIDSAADFRAWLKAHHATGTELLVGFWKVGSGRGGLTYKEALDEALCFGWIDGVRRSLDDLSYAIRFTPRRPKSHWSQVNVARVAELETQGRMTPAGRKAFDDRDPTKQNAYSFENPVQALTPDEEQRFRAKKKAWAFFEALPAGARRISLWWVVSVKRPETRKKRFEELVERSAAGRRIALVERPTKKPPSKS